VDIPWGQNGAGMQGVCSAALYAKLVVDDYTNEDARAARCFMQRQLGYLTNHKCTIPSSMCNTPDSEGYSYMVGCGTIICMLDAFRRYPVAEECRVV
jgi:hypothetical protein